MNDSVMAPGRSIASSAWLRATPTSSSTTAITGLPCGTENATEFLSHAASAPALTGAGAMVATCAAGAGAGGLAGPDCAATFASSPNGLACEGVVAGSTTCGAGFGFGGASAVFWTGEALSVVTLAPPLLTRSKPPR